MSEPKQPWLKFEAVKTSMRQDGKGTYMTLTIHPDEVPVDLLSARPGTRYMVGMLPLDDQDRPVKGRDMEEGDRAVQSAGMLCRNIKFQKWMENRGLSFGTSEEECSAGLKAYCEIQSRAELKDNRAARTLFIELREMFQNEIR
jgi:hypothetical protein